MIMPWMGGGAGKTVGGFYPYDPNQQQGGWDIPLPTDPTVPTPPGGYPSIPSMPPGGLSPTPAQPDQAWWNSLSPEEQKYRQSQATDQGGWGNKPYDKNNPADWGFIPGSYYDYDMGKKPWQEPGMGGSGDATAPPGIDPRLWAVFQQYHQTPTGQGTGNTDWQYWQGKITAPGADSQYYLNRLSEDFAGTGPDAGSGGGGGGGGRGSGGGGGFGGGGFSPITPTSQWSPDPRTNELYNLLHGQATQSLDVSAKDPVIRQNTDAFNAAETRQQNRYLSNLAEKGGNQNLSMEQRMSSEKIGQDTAQFQGQLMTQELGARRQMIQQALSGMGQFLSEQERLDLQNQLAIMDNMLGQAGLEQGAYQFDQNNAYRYSPLAY